MEPKSTWIKTTGSPTTAGHPFTSILNPEANEFVPSVNRASVPLQTQTQPPPPFSFDQQYPEIPIQPQVSIPLDQEYTPLQVVQAVNPSPHFFPSHVENVYGALTPGQPTISSEQIPDTPQPSYGNSTTSWNVTLQKNDRVPPTYSLDQDVRATDTVYNDFNNRDNIRGRTDSTRVGRGRSGGRPGYHGHSFNQERSYGRNNQYQEPDLQKSRGNFDNQWNKHGRDHFNSHRRQERNQDSNNWRENREDEPWGSDIKQEERSQELTVQLTEETSFLDREDDRNNLDTAERQRTPREYFKKDSRQGRWHGRDEKWYPRDLKQGTSQGDKSQTEEGQSFEQAQKEEESRRKEQSESFKDQRSIKFREGKHREKESFEEVKDSRPYSKYRGNDGHERFQDVQQSKSFLVSCEETKHTNLYVDGRKHEDNELLRNTRPSYRDDQGNAGLQRTNYQHYGRNFADRARQTNRYQRNSGQRMSRHQESESVASNTKERDNLCDDWECDVTLSGQKNNEIVDTDCLTVSKHQDKELLENTRRNYRGNEAMQKTNFLSFERNFEDPRRRTNRYQRNSGQHMSRHQENESVTRNTKEHTVSYEDWDDEVTPSDQKNETVDTGRSTVLSNKHSDETVKSESNNQGQNIDVGIEDSGSTWADEVGRPEEENAQCSSEMLERDKTSIAHRNSDSNEKEETSANLKKSDVSSEENLNRSKRSINRRSIDSKTRSKFTEKYSHEYRSAEYGDNSDSTEDIPLMEKLRLKEVETRLKLNHEEQEIGKSKRSNKALMRSSRETFQYIPERQTDDVSRYRDPRMEREKNSRHPNQARVTKQIWNLDSTEDKDKDFDEWDKGWKLVNQFNIIVEIQGDIFEQPEEYSLAHCVAEDMRMGSGIAVSFKRHFKSLPELLDQGAKQGGLATLRVPDSNRFIYYLVTKRESTGKPTYFSLWKSLLKMREHIKENKVTKLAIPRLGCGLDRLEWDRVKSMIQWLFKDFEIEIKVCNFQQSELTEEKKSKCKLLTKKIPITKIEPGTLILYFATTEGVQDAISSQLSKKFNFWPSFEQSLPKSLGEVEYFDDKISNYGLLGCVVRETSSDVISYRSFATCLQNFNKMNVQFGNDAFSYVAFQWVNEESYQDDLVNHKIITMLINLLRNVDVYVCRGNLEDDEEEK